MVRRGEGHREADPPAVADLLPDGRAAAGDGDGDPARRRGLLGHDRGRVRAPLLRRPRRARLARHPPDRSTGPPTASPSRRTTRSRPRPSSCPSIAFSDAELAALQTALSLLDGEFAYAEPLRLALQQLTWGRPSPLGSPAQRAIGLGITGSAGGAELSARLAKVDTAIYRRKRIEFEYFTMQTGETAARKVDPYELLFEGGQFYLVGWSHERGAIRVFRLSRIRGKVAYATKAEHDFQRPDDFDPRDYANRIPWQLGDARRHGRDLGLRPDRLARRAQLRPLRRRSRPPTTAARSSARSTRSPRLLLAWAIGYEQHARVLGPPELVEELGRRLDRVAELHRGEPFTSVAAGRPPRDAGRGARGARAPARGRRHPPGALRAAGHARLRADPGRPPRRAPPGRRGLRAAADLAPGAARGRRGAQRRQLRRRRLRALRRGAARPARSRSTRSPTRTRSTARRGCCRSRRARCSPRSSCSASTSPSTC